MKELEQLYGQRQELKELRKELSKQIKLLDKEARSLEKTRGTIYEIADSSSSTLITGMDYRQTRVLQTKIHLLRKVLDRFQGEGE